MSGIILVVLIFFGLAGALGWVAYFTYKKKLRRAKAIERGLKMVPIMIHLPPPSSDTAAGSRDVREVMREKTAQAEVLYNLLAGTATEGFKSKFYGQRHIALELVGSGGVVHFYAAVPVALVSVVKKAVLTAYPGARLEEVEDHNIFNQEGRLAATMGGEMVLRAESAYPIATYENLERDPMEALLTTMTALGNKDGVAIQLMIRPASQNWTKKSVALADSKRKGRAHNLSFTPQDLVSAAIKSPTARHDDERARGGADVSNLELNSIEAVEEKTKHPGFEVLVRVMVSTESVARSQQLLRDISTAFALFDQPGLNGFKFLPALDVQGLVTAFIFRFFPTEIVSNVLNSAELATLFHLPDSQFTPSSSVERQQSKQVDGPVRLPTVGLLFGYNEFRGVRKEIRLDDEDRRRHTYILGQTGTGKSTMLENLAVQDMVSGRGFAFIDPHGDSAEKLLALVPKERAEDVIYFNPADTEYPLGLNLFEFNDPTQKDFIIQETINMLYKLYDPGHTGIIGPRYEHWYRNAALTLMSDPNGSTFIEIPKVFTDTEYLKKKFKYLRDPTVIDFWTKEMGQTSDYHKSEMLGWFVSKFGAFQNNEMMRNIIGQTKSAFNIRDVMDHKKILIVNLSKGRVGELNSQLLGMIFVIKFQAAAMSRAEVPENEREDFCLYVDEFQNFSTDSFASILSEARKYRLNLIVANQFIGQLKPEIRDAVFGNIGSIVAHRMGPEDAEFMVKQFAPVFDVSDLVNLPNFNAAMRLMIGGLPSQPFSVRDSAPLGTANLELGLAVKQLSAAKFGQARAVVEAQIFDRLSGREPAPAPAAVTPPSAAAAPGAPASAMPGMAAMAGAMGAPMAGAAAQSGLAGGGMTAAVQPVASASAPQATLVQATPTAPAPAAAMTPPPIGAPPVDLPAAPVIATIAPPPAPKPSDHTTLSLTDITGGKPLPPVVPPAFSPADVPIVPSGAEPAQAESLASPPQLPSAQPPANSVGSGRPLEDDPYANIEVLGDLAASPEPAANQQVAPPPASPEPTAEPAASVVTTAQVDADQPLIHFVDPAAEKILEQPDAPVEAVVAEDLQKQMAEGLPDGVTFVQQTPAAAPVAAPTEPVVPATPVVPAAVVLPPVPVTPLVPPPPSVAPLVAPPAPAAPLPVTPPPPLPAPSVVTQTPIVAPPVAAASTQPLAPPPIVAVAAAPASTTGQMPTVPVAPPVPLPVAPPPPLPAPPPLPVQPALPVIDEPPKSAEVKAVPESNLSLAEALQKPPAPEPPPLPPSPAPSAPLSAPSPDVPPPPVTPPLPALSQPPPAPQSVAAPAPIAPPVQQPASVASPVVPPKPLESQKLPEPPKAAESAKAPKPLEPPKPPQVPKAPEAPKVSEPAKQPEPEVEKPPPPVVDKPPVAAAPQVSEQIEKAEHEIDDLLSTSLIYGDQSQQHHRLPEPVQPVRPPDDESGVDLEMNSGRAVQVAAVNPPPAQMHASEHRGVKVIQPLEPIVPPKETFARELAELTNGARAATVEKRPPEKVAAPVAPVQPPSPPAPPPPPPPTQTPAVVVKHSGELMGVPPAPPPPQQEQVPEGDVALPQAESLAAKDVAVARNWAEHEAQQKLNPAASKPSPAPAPVPAPKPAPTPAPAAPTPESPTRPATPPAPSVQSTPASSSGGSKHSNKKRHRSGRDSRVGERIESEAEAEHNRPTEAEVGAGSMTGKLILPSGKKPTFDSVQPKLERPKKLASGEVFVDEKGNVMVGD